MTTAHGAPSAHSLSSTCFRCGVLLALAAALSIPTGCATYTERSGEFLTPLQQGNTDTVILTLDAKQTGKDSQLYLVEAGRAKLLAGRSAESKNSLQRVIDEVAQFEEGAVIKLRSVGTGLLTSTVANDTASKYRLPGYELIMAIQAQSLNYLFTGDFENACVMMRRAAFAQDQIAEANRKEIEEAEDGIKEQNFAGQYETTQSSYADMGPVLGQAKSSFQNAYAWYMSGLFNETYNDPGSAYVHYKKAWELAPENPHVQSSVVRLAQRENPDEFADFKSRFPPEVSQPPRYASRVVVVFEENLISQRQSVKIPMPIAGTVQTIVFPIYKDPPYKPIPVSVFIGGEHRGAMAPLCSLQSLAYHNMKEQLPGIALRNMTRAITRGTAQVAMRKADNTALKLVSVISNVALAATDQADTRGWYTLPMVIQLFQADVPPGPQRIQLKNQFQGNTIDVDVVTTAGQTTLVWLADVRGWTASSVSQLGPTAAAARYTRLPPLLRTPSASSQIIVSPRY